ncbi:YkgJ family cysteine cluster protein [Maribellus maritimus]|uniref:YkgJ family cysteine cluster protein n=1 Tax=Maribellus maritimus TaxID=2870838 RepID=UPI001EEA0177|nr:YkgJ family cysteine cluster protein [Maribellus maritimus]MCG6187812.1 YkgJ family cysteine cluster protein [Maribellus maritimus]
MKINSKQKDNYNKLRKEIDSISAKLENEHKKHLSCKSGCDLCCMDYSIFPIEFFSILGELKKENFQPDTLEKNKSKNECIFLKEHRCTIYPFRPIICRTHGLPLLYANHEGEWELSACELNFTKFSFEEFTVDNTFPQDKFNSKLYLLNKDFITQLNDKNFSEFDLIPIKDLIKQM